MSRKIYLASSWRNEKQPGVLAVLRAAGHEVYDFRNPAPGISGFSWTECGHGDAKTIPSYLGALQSDRAKQGFALDKAALEWCDTCILLLPCGRSAHLELGYVAGQGKDTYVLLSEDQFIPDLMYLLNTAICTNLQDILDHLQYVPSTVPSLWHKQAGGHAHFGLAGHSKRLIREAVELCLAAECSEYDVLQAVDLEVRRQAGKGAASFIEEEIADVAILLDVIAAYSGVSVHEVRAEKMKTVLERNWEPDHEGVLWRPKW